jgi:hypothetical protein
MGVKRFVHESLLGIAKLTKRVSRVWTIGTSDEGLGSSPNKESEFEETPAIYSRFAPLSTKILLPTVVAHDSPVLEKIASISIA